MDTGQQLFCLAREGVDGGQGFPTGKVLASVVHTIERLQPHLPEEKQRCGVYVCVLLLLRNPRYVQVPIVHVMVGNVAWERMPDYYKFSREKPTRALTYGHKLSWESRDDARERYPGGVVAMTAAIGVSGLPSAADEVIGLEAFVDAGLLMRGIATEYAGISNNPYYKLLNP